MALAGFAHGTKSYRISNDHVIGFIQTEIGLLAIEGIATGKPPRGRLLNLGMDAGGVWKARLFMDIHDAPQAFFKESSNSLVIVTLDQLIRVYAHSET